MSVSATQGGHNYDLLLVLFFADTSCFIALSNLSGSMYLATPCSFKCTPLKPFHTLRKDNQALKRPHIMCTSRESLGRIWTKNFIFDQCTLCVTAPKILTCATEIDLKQVKRAYKQRVKSVNSSGRHIMISRAIL